VGTTAQDLLVKQLDQAHAMERAVATMLDGMIRTTSDPSVSAQLESHKQETEQHAEKLARCLERYGESPSKTKEALGMVTALLKAPADLLRGEQEMRNARDGFATEHFEIATYRLLESLAKAANDEQALQVARENAADEERMAARIERIWDKVVARVFQKEGVTTR